MISKTATTRSNTRTSFASEFLQNAVRHPRSQLCAVAPPSVSVTRHRPDEWRERAIRLEHSPARVAHHLRKQSPRNVHEAVLRASNAATVVLVQEAQDLPDPLRRPRVQSNRLREHNLDIVLYEFGRFALDDEDDEGEAAVDDDVEVDQPVVRPLGNKLPRVAGYATIQTTVDNFATTFMHGEGSFDVQSLHQDMTMVELLYTVVEEKNKWIGINRLQLQPRGIGRGTRRREFIVVECQKRFVLPDGRQGWVQSVQSVDIPGQHEDGVRGTIQRSGVVAIESLVHKNTLDVVVTAQIDFKGSATSSALQAVSKRRVLKILSGMAQPLEKHQVELMSFPGTRRFLELEFEHKNSRCKVCADKVGRSIIPGWKAARYSCRKCGGTVCRHCSHIWEIERQRTTAIVGGGRVITPTRVCNHCFSQRPAPAAPVQVAEIKAKPMALRERRRTDPNEPHFLGDSRFLRHNMDTSSVEHMRPTQLEFALNIERPQCSVEHGTAPELVSMKTINL